MGDGRWAMGRTRTDHSTASQIGAAGAGARELAEVAPAPAPRLVSIAVESLTTGASPVVDLTPPATFTQGASEASEKAVASPSPPA